MKGEVTYEPDMKSGSFKMIPNTTNRSRSLAIYVAVLALIAAIASVALVTAWFGSMPDKVEQHKVAIEELKSTVNNLENHVDGLTKDLEEVKLSRNKVICALPKDAGSCFAVMPRWYFDAKAGKCFQFAYGGCMGNANNFHTHEDCKNTCPYDETVSTKNAKEDLKQNPCLLSPSSGPCKGQIPRYYFDLNDGQCKKFSYSGCVGNSNNFLTLQECRESCDNTTKPSDMSRSAKVIQADVCTLPSETGPCRAMHERWFFDHKSGNCATFIWGGCGGNDNKFMSEDDCIQKCKRDKQYEQQQVRCLLKSETGPCRAAMPRYFYNADSGKCEMFLYGGCDGNANNFEDPASCMKSCHK